MHEDALMLLLKKLRFETDLVIHELESTEIEGAINWGDLECYEACIRSAATVTATTMYAEAAGTRVVVWRRKRVSK